MNTYKARHVNTDEFKDDVKRAFKCKDLGECTHFLGLKILTLL